MMILFYQTEQEAIDALAYLEEVAKQLWAAQGHVVTDDAVYSKNPRGETTDTVVRGWDEVKAHPDGGFYFASPRPRYPEYFDQLVSGNYQELEYEP